VKRRAVKNAPKVAQSFVSPMEAEGDVYSLIVVSPIYLIRLFIIKSVY
jgi:hypothetical protein